MHHIIESCLGHTRASIAIVHEGRVPILMPLRRAWHLVWPDTIPPDMVVLASLTLYSQAPFSHSMQAVGLEDRILI